MTAFVHQDKWLNQLLRALLCVRKLTLFIEQPVEIFAANTTPISILGTYLSTYILDGERNQKF